jgi:hypothetical protein
VLIVVAITRRGRSRPNTLRPPATEQFPKKAPSGWPAKKVEDSAAQPEAQVAAGAHWVCPVCRRAYPSEIKRCPHDGTDLIEYEQFTKAHKAQHTSGGQKRCPKCGVTYSDTSAFCPQDGIALVPINEGS